MAVLVQEEVLLGEVADNLTLLVADGGEQVDHLDVGGKGGIGLLLACWPRSRRMAGDRANADSRPRREILASNGILLERDARRRQLVTCSCALTLSSHFHRSRPPARWKERNSEMAFHLHAVERQVSAMYASPKRSALLSGLLHAAAIVAALSLASVKNPSVIWKPVTLVGRDIGRYLASVPREKVGGGGGGTRSDTRCQPWAACPGRPAASSPRRWPNSRTLNPQLPMEPTLVMASEIVLPTIDLPQFGDPNGVSGPPSGGRGSGGGIGDGTGPGVGDSRGPGYGPGPGGGGVTGRGSGGFLGGVTEPVLLWKIEPEYTDEARRAKIQGTVVLHIEVDTRGQAQNITVRQSLGLGLDERAIEAVRRWRFRPGYRNGKPWVTAAMVQVNFRLL